MARGLIASATDGVAWRGGVCAALLLVLNRDFYGFLSRKRGLLFALAAVPLHWLYFLYCAVAFVGGQVRYRLQ